MANSPFVAIFSNLNSSASTNRLWNHHKKTTERKRREGSCVTTEKHGTPSHLPAAHSLVSCTNTHVCACSTRIYKAQRHCYQSDWGATVCIKNPVSMMAFLPREIWKKSNLTCYKCVQKDTCRPQKLPRHPRSVLKASSAGHTGKFGLQRCSDGNKPQGWQIQMSKV